MAAADTYMQAHTVAALISKGHNISLHCQTLLNADEAAAIRQIMLFFNIADMLHECCLRLNL